MWFQNLTSPHRMVCFDGKFNKDTLDTTTNIKSAHWTDVFIISSRVWCMKLLFYSLLFQVKWTMMCHKLKKLFFTCTFVYFYSCTSNLICKPFILIIFTTNILQIIRWLWPGYWDRSFCSRISLQFFHTIKFMYTCSICLQLVVDNEPFYLYYISIIE